MERTEMFSLEKPFPLTNQYYNTTVGGTARIQSESRTFPPNAVKTGAVQARREEPGSCTTRDNNN